MNMVLVYSTSHFGIILCIHTLFSDPVDENGGPPLHDCLSLYHERCANAISPRRTDKADTQNCIWGETKMINTYRYNTSIIDISLLFCSYISFLPQLFFLSLSFLPNDKLSLANFWASFFSPFLSTWMGAYIRILIYFVLFIDNILLIGVAHDHGIFQFQRNRVFTRQRETQWGEHSLPIGNNIGHLHLTCVVHGNVMIP